MRNPFQFLSRSRDKPREAVSAAATFCFGISASGKTVNPRNAVQLSTVYACVLVIAQTIVSLPFGVYEDETTGSRKATEHQLYRLFLYHAEVTVVCICNQTPVYHADMPYDTYSKSNPVPDSAQEVLQTALRCLLSLPSLRYILPATDKEVLNMATKTVNFKTDEAEILEMKHVAGVFNMSVTDLIKNAVKEYIAELKSDPFYRLTANVQDASDEETGEILTEIEGLSDDDLTIASTKHFSV